MFASPIPPKAPTPTADTPYNPKAGPVIEPKHWTPEMITAPLTQDLLANQTDPAGFLNARRAACTAPTDAKVITEFNGQLHSVAPVEAHTLSTAEDQTRILARLLILGIDGTVELTETPLGGSAQRYEWGSETRRQYSIGPLNVGGLVLRYAVTLAFQADEKTKQELEAVGLLRT